MTSKNTMAQTRPTDDGNDDDLTLTQGEKIWYQIVFGKDFDEDAQEEGDLGEAPKVI